MAEKKISSYYTSLEIKDKMSQALKKCDDNLNIFRKTAKDTDKEINKVDNSLDKTSKSFQKWAIGIGAGYLALGSIKNGIQSLSRISDEYGQNASRIKNATSSLEEYNLVQQRILENANLTYRSLSEAQEVYIGLSGSLKALGVSSEDVLNITESLSFAFVRDAARADQATSAIDAYSKALQKGKNIAVSSDAWATMMAATPSLADSIASAFNKTTTEILNLGSTGKLSIEAINEGLKRSRDESERIASEMKTSNADAMQALSNSFTVFVGKVEESANMSKPFIDTINEISAFFQDPEVIKGVAEFAETIAKAFTSSLKFAKEFFGGIKVLSEDVASKIHGIAGDDIVRLYKEEERILNARKDSQNAFFKDFSNRINSATDNDLKNVQDKIKRYEEAVAKANSDKNKTTTTTTTTTNTSTTLPDLTVNNNNNKSSKNNNVSQDLNFLLKSYDKELNAFLKINDFKRKDNELLYKNYQKNFETYFKEKQAIELSDYKKQQEIFDAQLKDAQDTRKSIKATADNKKEIQTIDNNILEILNKKNALEEEYNFKLKESTFEYQNQIDKIKQMQQAMQSNIANLIGNSKKSETISLDVEIGNLRKENANNPEMLAYIDTLEQIKRAKIEQNEATRLLAISEEELNFNRENGSIQYADYNNKFNDIINRRIELLKQERDLVLQIGGEDSQARIKELDQQIKVLEQSSKSFGKEMNIVLRESFNQNLKDVISGTKSLKDAMIDMLNSIADRISSIVADNLTNSLFGEKGSGKGGLLEGLFGGGGGGLFSGLFDSIGSLMGFATGGVYNKGDVVKIGEGGGQEAFIASENGRIYNKEQMNRITNNNSNQSNVFNINIKADNPNEFRNSQGQLIAQVNQMMYIGKKNQ